MSFLRFGVERQVEYVNRVVEKEEYGSQERRGCWTLITKTNTYAMDGKHWR